MPRNLQIITLQLSTKPAHGFYTYLLDLTSFVGIAIPTKEVDLTHGFYIVTKDGCTVEKENFGCGFDSAFEMPTTEVELSLRNSPSLHLAGKSQEQEQIYTTSGLRICLESSCCWLSVSLMIVAALCLDKEKLLE